MESVEVIGTVYKGKNKEGDFDWHIRSGLYEDSLFIYNDDEKRRKWKKAGMGNAVIRKYNKYALDLDDKNDKPRSAGIVTGKGDSVYPKLTEDVKNIIDDCVKDIEEIVKKYGYKKVYYSASTPNGLLGTSIFQVGDDVLEYITKKLRDLKI